MIINNDALDEIGGLDDDCPKCQFDNAFIDLLNAWAQQPEEEEKAYTFLAYLSMFFEIAEDRFLKKLEYEGIEDDDNPTQ